MRVGQNPAKFVDEVTQPANITVAVVAYIPFLSGYYKDSLNVLKLCLESIWAHADLPYDLMIFDNASCAEVQDYLLAAQRDGKIQNLVLSEKNIGKAGAWNHIFGAAPGEFIAYNDSDVYFFPGWLSNQVKVLEALPNAGMVTGLPMLTPAEFSTNTVAWAESQPEARLERGRLLPWEDFWRHASSLGGDQAKARKFYDENEDICLHYGGSKYYVGAAHFQFVGRTSILRQMLPIPSKRPMGQVRMLDVAINEQGYLRLCTDQWYAQHMGNNVPDESFFAGQVDARSAMQAKPTQPKSLWRMRPLRKLLQIIHDRSFDILYRK